MKKIFLLSLLFLISLSAVKADYQESVALAKYKKALDAGCEKVIVKGAKTATVLSFLPGGGSFYTGAPGLGVVGVLLWPFSVAWEIPSSTVRAHERNKIATVINCEDEGLI